MFNLPHVAIDNETGAVYVSMEVVDRIFRLICDQRIFFSTRDKKLLKSCKDRENGFIDWYEKTSAAIAADIIARGKLYDGPKERLY